MELTLFVDHQCNLRCTYCYNGDKFSRRMSLEIMHKAVALALQQRPEHLEISFFGGEPLLALEFLRQTVDHVEATVAAASPPRPSLSFTLNTNATLIDEAALALMASPRRVTVNVSLDGPRDVHDEHRVTANGHGSFDAVMAGVGKLRRASVPIQVVAVVSPDTAGAVGRTARALLTLGALKVVLAPDFHADWTEEAIRTLREGLEEAGNAWMEQFRSGVAVPLLPLHSKILAHLKGGMPCPSRCLLAGGEITVSPSGALYPCAQMVGEDRDPSLAIGHVDRGIDLGALLALQRAKDRVEPTCAPCAIRDRCQSYCGCRHVALTGKLGEISAALCETEAAFIDQADRVAETLYAERSAAFIDYYYERPWVPSTGGKLIPTRLVPVA